MKKIISLICLIFVLCTSGCVSLSDLFDLTTIDYDELQVLVEETTLSTNIKITRICQQTVSSTLAKTTSIGSGVIFHETNNYYYFITNNHVTAKLSGYFYSFYTINDYNNNSYSGVSILQSSADYDLSIGRFPKGEEELSVVTLAKENASKNDIAIAVGQPNGAMNTISYGKVTGYGKISVNESDTYLSNVLFDVLLHSAYTTNGSSGGAVFNYDLELIAISFAGVVDSEDEFLYSCAIPIEKVNEFINIYDWCEC